MPSARGEALAYFRTHLLDRSKSCQEWPYSTNNSGYGQVAVDSRTIHTHVAVCEMWNGPRPSRSHQAAHVCHNRRCWNGDHLVWLTTSQNNEDKRRAT